MAGTKNNNRTEQSAGQGRVSKEDYYLNIAHEVAARSTCLRRRYGAVIVKEDQIIATGYNGAPRGTINCCDLGFCMRDKLKAEKGEGYDECPAVHAEQNAIIHASRLDMLHSDLYLVGMDCRSGELLDDTEPCPHCRRMIMNAGIDRLFIRTGDRIHQKTVEDWKWDYADTAGAEE